MITVTINGKKITLEKSVTILNAARKAGIEIPTLCNHEMLEPFGGCRLCLVEIEKMPKLQTSCTQYVTDGMVVWTETEQVVQARRAILEFLLINHPLDCPYCDKAGECGLQDAAVKYGPSNGRFIEGKRKHPECNDDPLIVTNMERCILCARCTRMCEDVQGASAITFSNRGAKSYIEPFSGGRFDCEYCGNCITVCPVGSLMSRLHKHTYRPWYIEKEVETICPYCGVGCALVAQTRSDSIVRVEPKPGLGLNKGLLCVKGRFGYDYVGSPQRLKSPLIRKDGVLQQATWTEAFHYVAEKLKKIKAAHGADAIGGIASGRCTNEDNYVFQKFMRVAVGTNNIDSAAGFAYAPARKFFEKIFGQGVTANPIQGIAKSDGVFVIGADPTSVNPVLGLQIRAAAKKGIPVITVGYMPGLKRFATHRLMPAPFTEPLLLDRLLSEVMKKRPVCGENAFFEEIIKRFMLAPVEDTEDRCGLSSDEIKKVVDELLLMTNPAIVIGRSIIQRSEADIILLLLSVLVYLLNGRIYLLSELPNEHGLVDMGCQPDMLPGGRPVAADSFRKKYEAFFGVDIPSDTGSSVMQMVDNAHSGKIKALYVMGENIVFNLPDSGHVKKALTALDFLVVQDIFMTETAQHAHVVLPSLAWVEKEGCYTNLEGRMQHLRKAVDGNGMEDWKIIAEIGKIIGIDMNYRDAKDVLAEITEVSPLHKGIRYRDMDGGQCLWPYKGDPLRQGSIEGFVMPDSRLLLRRVEKDKVYLGVDTPLFESGTLSRNSAALSTISHGPYVKIGTALADCLSLAGGDHARVTSACGSVELGVVIDGDVPENMALVPNHTEDKGALGIMRWQINSDFGCPALDGNEVKIEKIRT